MSRQPMTCGLGTSLAALVCLALAATAYAERITVAGTDFAAINAAIDLSKPGDTVFLPAGTYTIGQSISPKTGTRLEGEGQDTTIIHYAGESPSVFVSLAGCEDIEVCNLTLDGQMNVKATQGIFATSARRLNIHHVTVRNLGDAEVLGPHGIHFNGQAPSGEGGVTDSVIAECRMENIGLGVPFGGGIRCSWGSSRNRILRNTIVDTGRGGIFADNYCTDLIIQGNTIEGSGGEGLALEVWGECNRAAIEDNRVDHWLSIGGCDYVAVRRNVVSDRSGECKFTGIEAIGSYLVFTDNLVDGGAMIGLSVSGDTRKDYVFWAHNTVRDCNQWGAQFQGEPAGMVGHYLDDCTFEGIPLGQEPVLYPGDEGHGFRINGNCRFVTFEDCTFSGNGGLGLQLGGGNVDGLTFAGCAIKNNKAQAVLGPDEYTALEWSNCTVEGNAGNALPPAKRFPAMPPTASFEMPESARLGKTVRFRDTSTAVQGNIKMVLWDFGDGFPSNAPKAEHAYENPGDYRVTLVVWDEAGRGARAERLLTITD